MFAAGRDSLQRELRTASQIKAATTVRAITMTFSARMAPYCATSCFVAPNSRSINHEGFICAHDRGMKGWLFNIATFLASLIATKHDERLYYDF